MAIDWGRVWEYIYGNKVSIITFGGLLITSGVKTLPAPGTPFTPYAFLYDWSHQFFNIPNTRMQQSPPPVLIPPVAPAPNVAALPENPPHPTPTTVSVIPKSQ